jgi:hypothetical protein
MSIETTMKYYVVSSDEFEQEAIKRLDGKIIDTYTDTSKEKGLKDTPQPLDFISEPWRIRTSDPLIKSNFKGTLQVLENTCLSLVTP